MRVLSNDWTVLDWRQLMSSISHTLEHCCLYCSVSGGLMSWTSVSRFSIDDGRSWTVHNFTSTSVFVDGLLSEPGDETLVMT